MTSITRLDPGQRMSEGSVYNGTIYLAGQVANDASQDIRGQTRQVLDSIDALLAKAGSHKSRILMAQIFIANIDEFPAMNEIWDSWVDRSSPPSRATVQAPLAKPQWKIEIVVTAALA